MLMILQYLHASLVYSCFEEVRLQDNIIYKSGIIVIIMAKVQAYESLAALILSKNIKQIL